MRTGRKRYRTIDISVAVPYVLKYKCKEYNAASGRELCTLHFIFDNYKLYYLLSDEDLILLDQLDKGWIITEGWGFIIEAVKSISYFHNRFTKRKKDTFGNILEVYRKDLINYGVRELSCNMIIDFIYRPYNSFQDLLKNNYSDGVCEDMVTKYSLQGFQLPACYFPTFNRIYNIDEDIYIGINSETKYTIDTVIPLDYVYTEMNKTLLV